MSTVTVGPRVSAATVAGVSALHVRDAGDMTGDIELAPGQGISLTQDFAHRVVTITAADPTTLQGLDGNVLLEGEGISISKDVLRRTLTLALDGTHGVQSINGETGGINLVAGENVAIRKVGNGALEISTSAPSGGSGGGVNYGVADRATFFAGFGSPILPGSDYGLRHIVLRACRPGALFALLATPPAAGDFVFDIQRSQDAGATWTSILATPVVIPAGCNTVVATSSFAADGAGLAPGNLLRLVVLSSGVGPGFSNGFICTVRLDGADIPGFDRAGFALGFKGNVPVAQDLGATWIATRTAKPSALYCVVQSPPIGGDVHLDIQKGGAGSWQSIFPPDTPLVISAGVTAMISTVTFATGASIAPGELLRPILLSGPAVTGMGYNIALELEIS